MSKRPEADTLTDGILSHNEGIPVGSQQRTGRAR
jgi:hypothetical protein